MQLKWMPWIAAAACCFGGFQARAADLAVLPVQGVGLSPGDAEAIGALFARAVARDARVAVASPQEAEPLLGGGAAAASAAGQLGASSYIQLMATRVGRAVKLSGARFALDGTSLYRAETFGPSLDEMDGAISALAQALIWRMPVASVPAMQGGLHPKPTAAAETPGRSPSRQRGAHGPKLGLVVPRASGMSFLPSFDIQYDGRFGPPSYFVELGAGLMIPLDDNPTGDEVTVGGGYLELGASRYLWAGDVAPYLGAGLSPALWAVRAHDRSDISATCLAYAQLGMDLGRAGRARFYGEARLSQTLLAVARIVNDGTAYGAVPGEPHRPLLIAFQGGVGW